jgi:hypothetical protein
VTHRDPTILDREMYTEAAAARLLRVAPSTDQPASPRFKPGETPCIADERAPDSAVSDQEQPFCDTTFTARPTYPDHTYPHGPIRIQVTPGSRSSVIDTGRALGAGGHLDSLGLALAKEVQMSWRCAKGNHAD